VNTTTTQASSQTLPITAFALGALSLVLITIVSFIALALAAAAMVTGAVGLARSTRGRMFASAGMVAAGVAVAIFLVEVA
jgi:hypothetical protein